MPSDRVGVDAVDIHAEVACIDCGCDIVVTMRLGADDVYHVVDEYDPPRCDADRVHAEKACGADCPVLCTTCREHHFEDDACDPPAAAVPPLGATRKAELRAAFLEQARKAGPPPVSTLATRSPVVPPAPSVEEQTLCGHCQHPMTGHFQQGEPCPDLYVCAVGDCECAMEIRRHDDESVPPAPSKVAPPAPERRNGRHPLAEEVLTFVHAFGDRGRKDMVRDLARRIDEALTAREGERTKGDEASSAERQVAELGFARTRLLVENAVENAVANETVDALRARLASTEDALSALMASLPTSRVLPGKEPDHG